MEKGTNENVTNVDLIIREGLKELRKKVGVGAFYDEEMHALAHLMEARAAYSNSLWFAWGDDYGNGELDNLV